MAAQIVKAISAQTKSSDLILKTFKKYSSSDTVSFFSRDY
jgi:hypothetical protein